MSAVASLSTPTILKKKDEDTAEGDVTAVKRATNVVTRNVRNATIHANLRPRKVRWRLTWIVGDALARTHLTVVGRGRRNVTSVESKATFVLSVIRRKKQEKSQMRQIWPRWRSARASFSRNCIVCTDKLRR